jgi:hypothetical protein
MSIAARLGSLGQIDLSGLQKSLGATVQTLQDVNQSAQQAVEQLDSLSALQAKLSNPNQYIEKRGTQYFDNADQRTIDSVTTQAMQAEMEFYRLMAAKLNNNKEQFAELKQVWDRYADSTDTLLKNNYEVRSQVLRDLDTKGFDRQFWEKVRMPDGRYFTDLLGSSKTVKDDQPSSASKTYEIKFTSADGRQKTLKTTTNPEDFLAAIEAAQRRST